jgi:hypothetical protein
VGTTRLELATSAVTVLKVMMTASDPSGLIMLEDLVIFGVYIHAA